MKKKKKYYITAKPKIISQLCTKIMFIEDTIWNMIFTVSALIRCDYYTEIKVEHK